MANSLDYLTLVQAMQVGVRAVAGLAPDAETLESVRIGANTVMVDHGALIALLVSKGIIEQNEYLDAITDFMFMEVQRYEAILLKLTGKEIRLIPDGA